MQKDYVKQAIEKVVNKYGLKSIQFDIETKDNPAFGDFSSNAPFLLAKQLKKSPAEIADQIKNAIGKDKYIEKIEIAGGGFLNFFLKKEFFIDAFLKNKKISPARKKVIIDYSSPNVAKPMHVGHLRATLIGDFMARLYKFFGYKVISWNHLGDWGTQFGMLIAGYKKWGSKKKIDKEPIKGLLEIYVRFNKEIKTNPAMLDEAKEEFAKLEKGNKENEKILDWFLKVSLKEFDQMYKKLGILKFSVVMGESKYKKQLNPLIEDLKKKNIATLSQGAYIIPLEKFGVPPALIQKSDGATLYITRDIASLIYRIKKYKPDELIYVLGSQQNLHLKQLFAVAQIANLSGKAKLKHISFGWVLGPNGKKLATRTGEIIEASQIINQVITAAKKIVSEKRKDLNSKKRDEISEKVGIGALKYSFLKDSTNSDIIFDPQKALTLSGNSAPYLQYALVRLKSIFKKSEPRLRSASFGVARENFNKLGDLEIGHKKNKFI
ncbi:MAG: arginine--tRNA ligase [Candidatus Paceibacterota bacterium]